MNAHTNGHGEKLSRKQEAALAALLLEPTILRAAEVARLDPTTLRRWLKTPTFADEYRAARRQILSHAGARLQIACAQAIDTLEEIMADPSDPASARVSAARTVLDMAIKAAETEDITARLVQLERMLPELVDALTGAVKKHVSDPGQLRAISAEMAALCPRPDSPRR